MTTASDGAPNAATVRGKGAEGIQHNPRRASIQTRLLAGAVLLVLCILPLAGFLLAYNFRAAVTTAFDERLTTLLNAVVARMEYNPAEGRLLPLESVGDPRFQRVYSGWYWQITDERETTRTSRSLWDQRLPVRHTEDPLVGDITGPREEHLRIATRTVRLPSLEAPLHVTVAMPRKALDSEVGRFQWLLTGSLATLGLILLGGLAVQIRWGLAPMRKIHADLQNVESGHRDHLSTDQPEELARLSRAMNAVLHRDRRLIERGRQSASNLAHALKTPLGVLRTLAPRIPAPDRGCFESELQRLDTAVRHHLSRASAVGETSRMAPVQAGTALLQLIEGMERLATRRHLSFSHRIDPAISLRIDPQDFQELVGNLLENGFKWAQSRIVLDVRAAHPDGVEVTVSDDGPGMNPAETEAALVRGARLDETRSGSGLGLAIVQDLLSMYGGRLELQRSPLGGLDARIWLPGSVLAQEEL